MAIDSTSSAGGTVLATSIAFGVITFFVLSLRLFARVCVVRAVGTDDYLIIIASLLAWAFIVCSALAVKHGLGGHIVDMKDSDWVPYLQIVWLSSIFYNACLGFIKISVLTLYMRLGDRTLRRNAMVMIGVVACQAGGNVFACIFQCSPISKVWDLTLTSGKCFNVNAFYLANAAVNIFTDVLTYILPVPLVMNLQVPRNQKIGVGVMLCLGFFTCLSSIIRITFVPRLLASSDPTFDIAPAMYWSVIETNVGILAASIPSFKSLAKRYLPRLLGESSRNRGATKDNSKAYGTDTSRSGFVELADTRSGKLQSRVREDEVDSLDKIYGSGVQTGVEAGAGLTREYNSSEEMINPPQGRILAQTMVTRQVTGI